MNIIEKLDITTISAKKNKFIIQMPITEELLQPFGIMHGGINALLAETAASMGANLSLDNNKEVAVGIDIHTTHLKPMRIGILQTIATSNHIGHTTQNWSVQTYNLETNELISTSTVNILNQSLKK